MTQKNILMVPLLIVVLFFISCENQERGQISAQKEGEHISTDGLSAAGAQKSKGYDKSLTPDMETEKLVHMSRALIDAKDYKGALDSAQSALRLLEKQHNVIAQKALCHFLIAQSFLGLGKYENAITAAKESQRLSNDLPEVKELEPVTYFIVGNALRGLHKYEESLIEYRKALELFSKTPGTEAQQADCKLQIKNIQSLLNAEKEMSKVTKEIKTKTGEKISSEKQRELFGAMVDAKLTFDRATKQFKEGVKLFEAGGHLQALEQYLGALMTLNDFPGSDEMKLNGVIHMRIAQALLMIGKYDEAYTYSRNGLYILNKRKGNEREAASCHFFSSMALIGLEKHKEALREAKEALTIFSQLSGTEEAQKTCRETIQKCEKGLGYRLK